jgi:hypothetical protein
MRQHEVLSAGTASGVLGGIVMAAVSAIGAALQGDDPALSLAAIGETLAGGGAGGVKIAIGALLHLATCAAIGIFFAAVVPREFPTACAMGLGVGIALFTAGAMMATIVPWANPGFRERIQVIGGTWTIAVAAFGAALGSAPFLRRWVSGAAPAAADRRPVPATRAPAAPTARTS